MTPNTAGTERQQARLAWIDGLRGLAVLIVVISHAWNFAGFAPFIQQNVGTRWILLASFGPWGVSMFLVISGFCLAYGPLARRAHGHPEWFTLRSFVVSRCRRILPPYYAALFLFSALALYFHSIGLDMPIMRAPTLPDFIAHLSLVHNNSPIFAGTINSPFWSLGLEWQWYWVFPLLLLSCLRAPRATLLASLLIAVLWALVASDLPAISIEHTLPGRLSEFSCGILAAHLVVAGKRLPPVVLLALTAAGLAACTLVPLPLLAAGLYFPLCGLAFAALVVLAGQHDVTRRITVNRPLVAIGQMSYSLYLVHWPLMGAVEAGLHFGAHAPAPLTIAAGALCVLPFGWSFHILFERPFMYRRTLPAPAVAAAALGN